MELTLISRSKRVKEPIERDHYWYDSIQRKMLHERGGEMRFRYDPAQKRSIPYIVPHEEWVIRNDYTDIKKWIKDNEDRFNLSVIGDTPNRHVTVEVSPAFFDEVQSDLYNHKIVSDYDEREIKRW